MGNYDLVTTELRDMCLALEALMEPFSCWGFQLVVFSLVVALGIATTGSITAKIAIEPCIKSKNSRPKQLATH